MHCYDSEHGRIRQVTNTNTTLYVSDPGSGLKVEKVISTSGAVQWNEYLFAGGQMVGEHFTNIAGGVTTTSTRYFVTDHLGSIAVITDESGAVVERLSYDAWGKRRFATGADDPTGSIASQTTRGFTGYDRGGIFNSSNIISGIGGADNFSIPGSIVAPSATHADRHEMCRVANAC